MGIINRQGALWLADRSLADLSMVVSSALSFPFPARGQSASPDVLFHRGSQFIASCRGTTCRTRPFHSARGHFLSDTEWTGETGLRAAPQLEINHTDAPQSARILVYLARSRHHSKLGRGRQDSA